MKFLYLFVFLLPLWSFGQTAGSDSSCLCGGIKVKPNAQGIIVLEWIPEYPGGKDSFKNYLKANVILNASQNGSVQVSFLINCKGLTCGYKVKKLEGNITEESESAFLQALKKMDPWKPAKQQDNPVDLPFKKILAVKAGQIQ